MLIFHNNTVLMYFWSNKCSLGEQKRLLPKREKNYQPQTFEFQENAKYDFSRGTWKPYLSKRTDTLQWKLLHYRLQVTNSKTTWVKVLEYLILTVLKHFTYTKYMLEDAQVKVTFQSKTVMLWRSWGNRQRQGSMCRHFIEKLEQTISQKPKGTKNRMIGQTINHYIQQLTKN